MKLKPIIVVFIAIFVFGCTGNKEELAKERMQYYDAQMIKMDATTISDIYAEDGEILDPSGNVLSRGRDSIKHFLSTFENVKIVQNQSSIEKVEIVADTVNLTGTYFQVAKVEQDSFQVTGRFRAKWLYDRNGELLLKEMQTIPYAR